MAEIKHRQVGGGPGIAYAEILLPDDKDWGRGSYTTIFARGALWPKKAMMSAMFNVPRFQITVSVNAVGAVVILLGDTIVRDRGRLQLPGDMKKETTHSLQVEFVDWKIVAALLDGRAVAVSGKH